MVGGVIWLIDYKGGDLMETFTDGLSLEDFFELEISGMLEVPERKTGLKYLVFLDSYGKERERENNSPRLMIDLSGHDYEDIVPVSIDKFNPEVLIDREVPDFESVAEWIKKNYFILICHWNQKLDDVDVSHLFGDENYIRDSVKKWILEEYGEEDFILFKESRRRLTKLAKMKLEKLMKSEQEGKNYVDNMGR